MVSCPTIGINRFQIRIMEIVYHTSVIFCSIITMLCVKSSLKSIKYTFFSVENIDKLAFVLSRAFFYRCITLNVLQVNLCQKLLFLHQLTHNMTTDCSLFMKIVSSEYPQNMLCTQIVVFVLF